MIKIEIKEQDVYDAEVYAKDMGKLNNSITQGDGNISGFLGEIIVCDFIKGNHENTYDYDIISLDGKKIDVKTKRTNYEPKLEYDCSIAAYNTKQKCDLYVFVRVMNDMSFAWILGYKDKEEYLYQSTFMKRGQIDPSNNFTVKSDCYNLKISDLNGISDLI